MVKFELGVQWNYVIDTTVIGVYQMGCEQYNLRFFLVCYVFTNLSKPKQLLTNLRTRFLFSVEKCISTSLGSNVLLHLQYSIIGFGKMFCQQL